MRYLSKFNESNEEFDIEYFVTCFADLIDEFDGEYEHETIGKDESKQQIFFIGLNLPRVKLGKRKWSIDLSNDDISDRIKYAQECIEFYRDIEVAIKKVKINYPDYIVEINHETEDFDSGQGTTYKEAYIQIEFIEPIKTKTIEKGLKKGKLNFINSYELDGTWDVK